MVWGGVAAVTQDRPLPKLCAGGGQRTLDTTPFAKVFETPLPHRILHDIFYGLAVESCAPRLGLVIYI